MTACSLEIITAIKIGRNLVEMYYATVKPTQSVSNGLKPFETVWKYGSADSLFEKSSVSWYVNVKVFFVVISMFAFRWMQERSGIIKIK